MPNSYALSLELVCGHHLHLSHNGEAEIPRVHDCRECDMLAAGNETLHERFNQGTRMATTTRTTWDSKTYMPKREVSTRRMEPGE